VAGVHGYNQCMVTDASYACHVARRRAVAVNGLRLHALEWGEPGRPALCFLHGGSAHAHWFDAVVPAFTGRYHVISLDQRGHGESQWAAPPAYATEDFVSDLKGVADALGWERMALVGHSMGGHNSMAFAAWHPHRLWALCVVDSRPGIPRERLEALHRRGHRGPRPHPSLDVALRNFRLLPPDTTADAALLDHLGRQGIVQRDGRFLYRFDPACSGGGVRPTGGRSCKPSRLPRCWSAASTRPCCRRPWRTRCSASSRARASPRSRAPITTWCWTRPGPSVARSIASSPGLPPTRPRGRRR
jgi:pimeloyl-ACP methyl ester carboxylesterase